MAGGDVRQQFAHCFQVRLIETSLPSILTRLHMNLLIQCSSFIFFLFFPFSLIFFPFSLFRYEAAFLSAEEMTRARLIAIHAVCWLLPLLLAIGLLINTYKTDNALSIMPCVLACQPNQNVDATLYLLDIPITICATITTVALSAVFIRLISRNKQVLYYQWRTLLFGVQSTVLFIFMIVTFYYYGRNVDVSVLMAYPNCMASYPEDPDPPCSPTVASDFWFFCLFYAQTFAWIIVFSLYVYWSNPLTWLWWKLLFVHKRRPTREDIIADTRSQG